MARTAGLPFKVPSPLAPNLCPPPPLYREGGEPLYDGSIDVDQGLYYFGGVHFVSLINLPTQVKD